MNNYKSELYLRDNGDFYSIGHKGYYFRYLKDEKILHVFYNMELIKTYKIEDNTEWYYNIMKTKIKITSFDKIYKDLYNWKNNNDVGCCIDLFNKIILRIEGEI